MRRGGVSCTEPGVRIAALLWFEPVQAGLARREPAMTAHGAVSTVAKTLFS